MVVPVLGLLSLWVVLVLLVLLLVLRGVRWVQVLGRLHDGCGLIAPAAARSVAAALVWRLSALVRSFGEPDPVSRDHRRKLGPVAITV